MTFGIKPAEEMNLHLMLARDSVGQYVPSVCELAGKSKTMNFPVDTNSRRRFDKAVLEIWRSHLGNYTMHAFLGPSVNKADEIHKIFKYCDKFCDTFTPEFSIALPYISFPIIQNPFQTEFGIPSFPSDPIKLWSDKIQFTSIF